MKNSTKKIITTVTVMALLTCLLIWLFYILTNKPQVPAEKTEKTEVEKLIGKDIKSGYPQNPREVLRLYCRITKCMYNEEMSESEFEELADQLRLFYDDELLEENERASFLVNLKAEVNSYKENKITIASYDVQEGIETDYATIKKENYATLRVAFMIRQQDKNKGYAKTYEQFLFRKNEEGEWKIAHWKQIDNATVEGLN